MMKNKGKRITFRISEETYKSIESFSKASKKGLAKWTRDLVEDHMLLRKATSVEEFLEQLTSVLPDFQQYQAFFSDIKTNMTRSIEESGRVAALVNDMKKGEGFYFKNIYEAIKTQQTQFHELVSVLSEEPKPHSVVTSTPNSSKSASQIYLEKIERLKAQENDSQNH